MKIMFPTTASKKILTKTSWAQLMNYRIVNMIQTINESTILYQRKQKSATEVNTFIKPTTLPTIVYVYILYNST
jgi:hypothetical protein